MHENFDFDAADPDWDHVPADLRAMRGCAVTILDPDEGVGSGVLVIAPGFFGDAARAAEGP